MSPEPTPGIPELPDLSRVLSLEDPPIQVTDSDTNEELPSEIDVVGDEASADDYLSCVSASSDPSFLCPCVVCDHTDCYYHQLCSAYTCLGNTSSSS